MNKDNDLIFEAYKQMQEDSVKGKVAKGTIPRAAGWVSQKVRNLFSKDKKGTPKLKGDEKLKELERKAKAEETAERIAAAKKKAGEVVDKGKELGGKAVDATVDAAKGTAGAAVDLGKAGVNFASPYVTRLADGGYRLAGKGVDITFKKGEDMVKWIGKNPGRATSLGLGTTAVGTGVALAPSAVEKGKEFLGVEPDVIDQLETKEGILNAVKNTNPKFSGMSLDEIAKTPEGIAALKAANLGHITPGIGPKGWFTGRYLDDKGQIKGTRVAGDLALGTAGAIGAKLAYDYLKPKKKKDEDEA